MRAVTFSEFGGGEVVTISELPDPVAAPGQVLVAVEAASINPVDAKVLSGAMPKLPTEAPFVLGWDLAGHIVAVGQGVDAALVGAYVVGFSPWFAAGNGTQKSLIALDREGVAIAPPSIPPTELTTLGLNALTALQVVERSGATAGTTILVTGAAGAVGGYAVELAAQAGARVFGMAAAADEKTVLGFGAEEVVPRDLDEATTAIRTLVPGGVDVVIDTASLAGSIAAVKDGGHWLTVSQPAEPERGIEVTRVGVKANSAQLGALVELAATGDLALRVDSTYPAENAGEAYKEFARGHRGRVVLTF